MKNCKYFNQCHNPAQVYVPYSNTALCKMHFLRSIEHRVRVTIEQHKLIDFSPHEKILVALSGGKDSQSLLTILDKVIQKRVPIEALYIDLGISPGNYSTDSGIIARSLCETLKIPFHVVDSKQEIGISIDNVHEIGHKLFRNRKETKLGSFRGDCSYCGLFKRYLINKFAVTHGFTKLATGHNLTDEATALMANFFSMDLDLMARAGPTTESDVEMLIPRIKPLYYIYEKETILYAFYANVPHLPTECEYALDAPMSKIKMALDKVENVRKGNMLHMLRKYQLNLKPLLAANVPAFKKVESKCDRCGGATYLKTCAFCKTKARLLELKQIMNSPKSARPPSPAESGKKSDDPNQNPSNNTIDEGESDRYSEDP